MSVTYPMDLLARAFWWCVLAAAIWFAALHLQGCSLQNDFDGYTFKHDGRYDDDADAGELEPGTDAGQAMPDAAAPDASTEAGAESPDTGPEKHDSGPPPPPTLEGAWQVTASLVSSSCQAGTLGPLTWRIRPGQAIEQPPPDNALVWQDGAYTAASGGWVVHVQLELNGTELGGTLEREQPPQCERQRWTLRGVRP